MTTGDIGILETVVKLTLVEVLNEGGILVGYLYAGNIKFNDFNTAKVTPLSTEYLVESFTDFLIMSRNLTVADILGRDLSKCILQRGQYACFELTVNLITSVLVSYIGGNVCIEENWIGDAIAVLTKAADFDIKVYIETLVNNMEGDAGRGAVFIPHDFLGVNEVYALVFTGVAAEGETLTHLLEYGYDILLEFTKALTVHDGRLGGCIVGIAARLSTHIYYLTILNNNHALTGIDINCTAAGNDVVFGRSVGTASH